MPLKLPSLQEVFDDPSILMKLPTPAVAEILERVKQVEQAVGGDVNIAPTPTEMAITNPKFKWMDTPHLHYLGEQVAAAVDRNGAIVVTMPPRHAKSHTCSVWTPFWFLAQRPDAHVLLLSYEASFARKWGAKVRGLVEMYGKEYGLQVDPKKTAGDDWELTTGGGMKTVGAGGGIAGNPAKLLIADDLIKNDEEARSALMREKIWDWWEGTVLQRVEPDTTVILIGTRYHEDDIIGRVLQASAARTGLEFEEITLRAKAEEKDPLDRLVGHGLWPNHPLPTGGVWGQTYYDEKEASVSPYVWNSVYQQRPSAPGGNMVDPAWWRFYRPNELPPDLDQELQTWDLSLDAQKQTDSYHAGLVMGRKGALVYLRDAFHEHGKIAASPNAMERTVISCIRNWNQIYPGARYKLVERSLAGPMLIQVMQSEVGGMLPWPPKGQRKGSKEACLNACIPDIRSGNVLLPLNHDGSRPKWVQEFIEEMRQFPRAPHDDYVDSFSQGMAFLLPAVRRAVESDHHEALSQKQTVEPVAAHTAALHSNLHRLADRQTRHLQEKAAGPSSLLRFRQQAAGKRAGRGLW